jgi:hypothetical protein
MEKVMESNEQEAVTIVEKKPRPNAWKAGRKPDPKANKRKRTGTDETGGSLAIKSDPGFELAERDDPAYTKFSEIVGGKEGLKELAAWSENPKAQKLFQLIDDGRYKTYGIKALAKRCGMTLPELCNLFREKHFLDMYFTFFGGVADIAKGAVEDAKPTTDVCPMCGGDTFVKRGEIQTPCPKCQGTGRIRVAGDKEARRDVFKAVGVIKDSPAVVNQNIGNVTVEGVDNFEDLMRSAKAIPINKGGGNVEVEEEIREAEIIEG